MPPKKPFRKRKNGLTLKKVNNRVSRMKAKIEIKEKSFVQTAEALPATDTGFVLNGMSRGSNNGSRVADKIYMKNINLNYHLEMKTQLVINDTPLSTFVRVLIFVNRQNNGDTTFDMTEILTDTANQNAKIVSIYEYRFVDKDEKLQYKILYDKTHFLIQGQNGSGLIKRIKLRLGHKVNYNSSNLATGADIINNKLELVFIPENTNLNVSVSSVLSYSDT